MRERTTGGACIAAVLFCLLATPAPAAGEDVDWPCASERIERLSLAQIWRGDPLPEDAAWAADREIAPLAQKITSLRISDDEAVALVRAFAESQPPGKRRERLLLLLRAAFETADGKRRRAVRGVEAYARNQKRLAERIVEDTERLQADSGLDEATRAELGMRRDWNLRIFEDRRAMLQVICEEPDRYERRVFAIARTIEELLQDAEGRS